MPSAALSERMSKLRRRDTKPEVELRRELHRMGLRFRLQARVPGNNRRTIDIAFPRARLAVFVDGCFWHGCSEHQTHPATNPEWWSWKLARNVERDRDTDRLLAEADWKSLRVWEHEPSGEAAKRVSHVYAQRIRQRT